MRQESLMPLADPAWIEMLRAEAAKPGRTKAEIGRELGISCTAVSLICKGDYSAKLDKVSRKVAGKVMALYGQQVWCPHLRAAITPGACEDHRTAPMAMSDPAALKHWVACRGCPQNPAREETANAV